MALIDSVLEALDFNRIIEQIEHPHNNAREAYGEVRGPIRTFQDYSDIIGDYYRHHFTRCLARGGSMPKWHACSRAKEIIQQEYDEKYHGNIVMAFNDAHKGHRSGIRAQLDLIAERLKAESVQRYMRDVLDRHIEPDNWDARVEIVRQIFARYPQIATMTGSPSPEKYAQKYVEFIQQLLAFYRQIADEMRKF